MPQQIASIYSPHFLNSDSLPPGKRPLITRINDGGDEPVMPLHVFDGESDTFSVYPERSKPIYPLDMISLGESIIHPGGRISTCNTLLLETFVRGNLRQGLERDDLSVYSPADALNDNIYTQIEQDTTHHLNDRKSLYAWAYSHYSYNFGHWHGEMLSALASLSSLQNKTNLIFPILSDWQRECLDLCGFPKESYQEVPLTSSIKVPNLQLSSSSWVYKRDNYKAPLTYLKLVKMIRKNAAKHSSICTSNASRIYLSRKRVSRRAMQNENEVEEAFAKRGFTIVDLEGMPYCDGIQLASNADIIAGPSGSAMTRVLFAKKSCKFIQISIKGGWHTAYHFNASVAGVSASYAYAESLNFVSFAHDASPLVAKANTVSSWSVNIAHLNSFLDSIL